MARAAVPIGVRYAAHPRIGVGIVEQRRHLGKEQLLVGAHQFGKPQFHGLRAFGCFSGNQHRFPKGWRLLLNPARISDHKMAALQQKHQLGVIDRLGQEHVRVPAKRLNRVADAGISVNRKDNRGIAAVGDACHGAAKPGDPAIEAFAAVTRHKNH